MWDEDRRRGRGEGKTRSSPLLSSSLPFFIGAEDDVQTQLRASSLTLQDVHLSKRQNHLKKKYKKDNNYE